MIGFIVGVTLLIIWGLYVLFMACYFSIYGFSDILKLIRILLKYSNALGVVYSLILFLLTLPAIPLACIISFIVFIGKSIIAIGFRRSFRFMRHKFYQERSKE